MTTDAWDLGIDVRHLRYFLEVAETGNFTKAAANVGRRQPPVSNQIKNLEEILGVVLFHRGQHGARLTDAGRVFREEAREVLERLGKAVNLVREAGQLPPKLVRIGYAPSPTKEFLDVVMRHLRREFPKTRFSLVDCAMESCLSEIHTGSMDFGLSVEPAGHTHGIQFVELTKYEMRCAASLDHPFAAKRSLPVARLKGEPLLILSKTEMPQYFANIASFLKPHRIRPKVAAEYDGIEEILPEVATNRGVALLLQSSELLSKEKLAWLPIRPALPSVPIGIFHKERLDIPTRAIVDRILKLTEPLRDHPYGAPARIRAMQAP